MKIIQSQHDIIISGAEHFDLSQIFDCGQCFRFNKEDGGAYSGIAKNRIINWPACLTACASKT